MHIGACARSGLQQGQVKDFQIERSELALSSGQDQMNPTSAAKKLRLKRPVSRYWKSRQRRLCSSDWVAAAKRLTAKQLGAFAEAAAVLPACCFASLPARRLHSPQLSRRLTKNPEEPAAVLQSLSTRGISFVTWWETLGISSNEIAFAQKLICRKHFLQCVCSNRSAILRPGTIYCTKDADCSLASRATRPILAILAILEDRALAITGAFMPSTRVIWLSHWPNEIRRSFCRPLQFLP